MSLDLDILTSSGVSRIVWTPEIQQARQDALESASLIGVVKNAEQQTKAAACQTSVAEIIKLVTAAHKAAKAPILDQGRMLDAAKNDFLEPLLGEERRLAKVVGDFQQLEIARAKAAEAAARREQERIAREAEAAQRAAQAEIDAKAREEEELQKKLREAESLDHHQKLREQAEAANRQRQAMEREQREAKARAEQEAAMVAERAKAAAPARAAGQKVVTDWDFSVTDIWALARAYPNLVTVEPKRKEIKAALSAGLPLPGILAQQVTTSRVVTKKEAAINI